MTLGSVGITVIKKYITYIFKPLIFTKKIDQINCYYIVLYINYTLLLMHVQVKGDEIVINNLLHPEIDMTKISEAIHIQFKQRYLESFNTYVEWISDTTNTTVTPYLKFTKDEKDTQNIDIKIDNRSIVPCHMNNIVVDFEFRNIVHLIIFYKIRKCTLILKKYITDGITTVYPHRLLAMTKSNPYMQLNYTILTAQHRRKLKTLLILYKDETIKLNILPFEIMMYFLYYN
jgi:hypothetical protein